MCILTVKMDKSNQDKHCTNVENHPINTAGQALTSFDETLTVLGGLLIDVIL